jgi:multimeric flavodoxin WrbA
VSMANGGLYRRRVGMAVAAERRSGGSRTIDTMLHFLLAGGMVVPGFPVLGVGREIGDVNNDEEGIGRARDAAKNMAWLIKTMKKAQES